MGGAKASPRICAAGLSTPLSTGGPATTLLLFKVKRQVQLQAKSTAQSANREKSSRLAVNFNDTSSPVDLECEIAAKCVLFTQRSRESRKLKTGWRSELNSNCRATSSWSANHAKASKSSNDSLPVSAARLRRLYRRPRLARLCLARKQTIPKPHREEGNLLRGKAVESPTVSHTIFDIDEFACDRPGNLLSRFDYKSKGANLLREPSPGE